MDIGDIGKVASRKRINTEVEKLRDKISRETAKVIKLKVAQDTAYWDLKEKLQQVEGNHERLQQNMVEVQMQHETLSGQYQEELRLRPVTLNKLSSSCEISEVLQDYGERLKDTLTRCKGDQMALCDAYQRSRHIVREIKEKQLQANYKSTQLITSLEEKVKITTDHQNQLVQFFTAFKQQADSELSDLKAKVKSLHAKEQEMAKTVNEQNRFLDQYKFDLDKKEETITNLQKDINQLISEYNTQRNEARNIIQQKEKEFKEVFEANKELKEALANQEQYTKSVSDQNNELVEKISAMEEEHDRAATLVRDMKIKMEETTTLYNELKKEVTILVQEKRLTEMELMNKDEVVNKHNEELEVLREEVEIKKKETENVSSELELCRKDIQAKVAEIQELATTLTNERNIADEIKRDYEQYKSTVQVQIQELTNQSEAKDKELDSKASTITQLMSEMKTGTDMRSKLEVALQKLKQETEIEKEADREKQSKMTKKIEHLEASIKDKDESMSKQMSIIMEMRNEKERLQEKIQGMQNTIDNIQKELTGRPAPLRPADFDDNAVMLTPSRKGAKPQSPVLQKKNTEFAVPRIEPKFDNMLYNLFSDSSMEGDTIDAAEVNRRFHAISRGERMSPRPIASLKRRSGVPAGHGGLKMKPTSEKGSISLSQVRDEIKHKERKFFKNKRQENKTNNLN